MSDNWYDRHILPYLLDVACGVKPVRRQREKVVPLAAGRVLEVGVGTGLNMRHYDRSKVAKITGLDPALQMHRLARKRIARAGLEVERAWTYRRRDLAKGLQLDGRECAGLIAVKTKMLE